MKWVENHEAFTDTDVLTQHCTSGRLLGANMAECTMRGKWYRLKKWVIIMLIIARISENNSLNDRQQLQCSCCSASNHNEMSLEEVLPRRPVQGKQSSEVGFAQVSLGPGPKFLNEEPLVSVVDVVSCSSCCDWCNYCSFCVCCSYNTFSSCCLCSCVVCRRWVRIRIIAVIAVVAGVAAVS